MHVARAVMVRQARVGTESPAAEHRFSATGATLSGDRQMLEDQQHWMAAGRAQ